MFSNIYTVETVTMLRPLVSSPAVVLTHSFLFATNFSSYLLYLPVKSDIQPFSKFYVHF